MSESMKKTAFALLIIIFLFAIGWVNEIPNMFIQTRELCLQYFTEGTLYGGQPYCVQGPVTYAVVYIFNFIPINLDVVLKVFYFISIVMTIYLTYKIKEAETKDAGFIFITFLSLFLFLKENDFATFVALPFLMSGFYFLYYGKKKMFGSILLGLALFSKVQTIFIVGPIFLFYAINTYKEQKRKEKILEKVKSALFSLFICLTPSTIFFILSSFLFKYFLEYYVIVHQIHPTTVPLITVLTDFFSFKYAFGGLFLLLYVGLFMAIIRALNTKIDVFSFIVGISLPIFFIKVGMSFGTININTYYRYFLVFAPFYFIHLYKIKQEFFHFRTSTKVCFGIGLLVLCIPLYQALGGLNSSDILDGSIFNEEKIIDKIKREVSYPLFTLNSQGNIIVGKEYWKMFGNDSPFLYLQNEQFVNINPDQSNENVYLNPDRSYADQFVTLGIVSLLEQYDQNLTFNSTEITEKYIMSNNTFAIINWPLVTDVLNYVLILNNRYIQENYCMGVLPFLYDPYFPSQLNYVMIYIHDKVMCEQFGRSLFDYYSDNFAVFCSRSRDSAEAIVRVLEINGMKLEKTCTSYPKTGVFLTGAQIQASYMAFFVILFLSTFFYKDIKRLFKTR